MKCIHEEGNITQGRHIFLPALRSFLKIMPSGTDVEEGSVTQVTPWIPEIFVIRLQFPVKLIYGFDIYNKRRMVIILPA